MVLAGISVKFPVARHAYIPAPTLQQVVWRPGPLSVRTVLLLVGGVAEAIQGTHGVGVVHRDLEPADVLTASDGPRVIDFGIARAADAALTGTGLRIGTAAFMAPDRTLGRQVTTATDVLRPRCPRRVHGLRRGALRGRAGVRGALPRGPRAARPL
ncbi:protein kinase [Streptomyces sp. NPDC127166]|uniref:protein kinase domain-containing protein n=1 Tax=Streptomyces sp. NPDC127166 TaxID=3345380 RepID=UPI003643DB9D